MKGVIRDYPRPYKRVYRQYKNVLGDPFIIRDHTKPEDAKGAKFIPNETQRVIISKARQWGTRRFPSRLGHHWRGYNYYQEFTKRLKSYKEGECNMKFVTESVKNNPVVQLKLEQRGDEVVLKASNGQGQTKVLLGFKDGKFFRFGYADMQGIETTTGSREIIEKRRDM